MALLEIDRIDKSFGGLRVIQDVSVAVEAGERVALIGPNGAGKTTLFNLITGVYPLTGGAIRIDGTDISALPDWRRARYGIARSFQNIRLMPHLSAVENVMLAQTLHARGFRETFFPLGLVRGNRWEREAREALERAGLAAYAGALVATLPYGIQKRIELVRASVAGARLLLLDEPAAGLNPAETTELVTFVRDLSERGMTLLIVEHDMRFVEELCPRIVVLNFGEKIADGSAAVVRADPVVREAYLGTGAGA
jgi:branched-chain amino acid transport system ATP-binding protein